MTSENYRQLLNNEFEAKEMTTEDSVYHKEQKKGVCVERREQLVSFLRQYQKACEFFHVNKIDAKDFVETNENDNSPIFTLSPSLLRSKAKEYAKFKYRDKYSDPIYHRDVLETLNDFEAGYKVGWIEKLQ